MYICGLNPQNFVELTEAVPIDINIVLIFFIILNLKE